MEIISYLLRLLNHRIDATVYESFGDFKQACECYLKAYELMDDFAFHYYEETCQHLPVEERQLPPFIKFYPEYIHIFTNTITRGKKYERFMDLDCCRREDYLARAEETLRYSHEIAKENLGWIDDVPGSCLEGPDGGWIDDGYEDDDCYDDPYEKQRKEDELDRQAEADIAQWEKDRLAEGKSN